MNSSSSNKSSFDRMEQIQDIFVQIIIDGAIVLSVIVLFLISLLTIFVLFIMYGPLSNILLRLLPTLTPVPTLPPQSLTRSSVFRPALDSSGDHY
ncbi:unnamed protein product [Adineta steineri]|uniref:Uncharacterized protein n=1 Tax=Adineta steineri TaxID=433720 RepID=A0A815KHU7_9BILA|nr:unnamed protein product [Adineta steineri]CAF1451152.1 unnamed protein product [Adineta steineri]